MRPQLCNSAALPTGAGFHGPFAHKMPSLSNVASKRVEVTHRPVSSPNRHSPESSLYPHSLHQCLPISQRCGHGWFLQYSSCSSRLLVKVGSTLAILRDPPRFRSLAISLTSHGYTLAANLPPCRRSSVCFNLYNLQVQRPLTCTPLVSDSCQVTCSTSGCSAEISSFSGLSRPPATCWIRGRRTIPTVRLR